MRYLGRIQTISPAEGRRKMKRVSSRLLKKAKSVPASGVQLCKERAVSFRRRQKAFVNSLSPDNIKASLSWTGFKMRIRATLKSWPRTIAFLFACVPVGMMLFIIVVLIKESIPALKLIGLGQLFSTQFSGRYTGMNLGVYGLLPAIWGTLVTTTIAMIIAIPVSLAFAVFTSEFAAGFMGRMLRGVFGVLSGIPPIVYALAALAVLITPFFKPVFAGPGGEQGFNYQSNSMIVVSITLALLVIPFMAPLFYDSLRNIPRDLKEASFGLGASRWHTATRVVIPFAMPGLIAASALGALLAMGEVIIPGIVGVYQSGMPKPFYDIFDGCATLTSVGASLLASQEAPVTPKDRAAGMFAAVLLLVLAFLLLALSTFLQKKFRKRFSQ